jgi:hypothetical protein
MQGAKILQQSMEKVRAFKKVFISRSSQTQLTEKKQQSKY